MKKGYILNAFNEGTIKSLEGGDTKHAFLLTYENKKYILRKFSSKKDADHYLSICKKLLKHHFLPKYYHQKGKDVLFEYIEGRDCNKKDASKVAGQVGEICGFVNKLNNKIQYNADKRFFSYIEDLKKANMINKEKASKIKSLYISLKKKVKPKIKLDANDVYPENFRLNKGKVYLVDIEAIKPLFQGHGIAKSFIRWFKTPKQRKKFKEGYKSVNSIKFLTEEYLQFLYLNFFMRSIAIKLRLKTTLNPQDIIRLNSLLECNLK